MAHWVIVAGVLIAAALVLIVVLASSWMEHRRRMAALELIKAAYAAGKEPPPELISEILNGGQRPAEARTGDPWGGVIVFAALGVAFTIAAAGKWMQQPSADEVSVFAGVGIAMLLAAGASAVLEWSRARKEKG
jgi:hypothetical protein